MIAALGERAPGRRGSAPRARGRPSTLISDTPGTRSSTGSTRSLDEVVQRADVERRVGRAEARSTRCSRGSPGRWPRRPARRRSRGSPAPRAACRSPRAARPPCRCRRRTPGGSCPPLRRARWSSGAGWRAPRGAPPARRRPPARSPRGSRPPTRVVTATIVSSTFGVSWIGMPRSASMPASSDQDHADGDGDRLPDGQTGQIHLLHLLSVLRPRRPAPPRNRPVAPESIGASGAIGSSRSLPSTTTRSPPELAVRTAIRSPASNSIEHRHGNWHRGPWPSGPPHHVDEYPVGLRRIASRGTSDTLGWSVGTHRDPTCRREDPDRASPDERERAGRGVDAGTMTGPRDRSRAHRRRARCGPRAVLADPLCPRAAAIRCGTCIHASSARPRPASTIASPSATH